MGINIKKGSMSPRRHKHIENKEGTINLKSMVKNNIRANRKAKTDYSMLILLWVVAIFLFVLTIWLSYFTDKEVEQNLVKITNASYEQDNYENIISELQAEALKIEAEKTLKAKEVVTDPIRNTKTYDEFMNRWEEIHKARYEEQKPLEIYMTSYNAEVWQTDSTPCIAWGTWTNICDAEKEWRRIIALSQELTAWSIIWRERKKMNCWKACLTFEANSKVFLKQTKTSIEKQWYNSRCNWEFEVADAMNVRYRKRWDLFFSDRAMNTSCAVEIHKIILD